MSDRFVPLLPVRSVSPVATLGAAVAPRNRPLRVLFMATSPEGVEPVLSYEAEEAGILARDEVDLAVRLRYLFGGPLGQVASSNPGRGAR